MSAMPHHTHSPVSAATTMASALNQMNGPNMSSHMNPMSSHGLHGGVPARADQWRHSITYDCLEYNPDTKAATGSFKCCEHYSPTILSELIVFKNSEEFLTNCFQMISM